MSRIGTHYRTRRLKSAQECVICGEIFFARHGAKTCCPAHRKRLERLTNGTERKQPVTDIRANICDTEGTSGVAVGQLEMFS